MFPSIWQLLIVLAIVLLLFGAKRIPSVMRDLGQGIRSFRDGVREEEKPEEAKQKHLSESDK